ncbi:MAG: dual specificity protein phosphatase family protein [Caldisericia bacterium]|nr:dual specificity protein phosphatase family protein [Caldisericia bacterium]
MDSVFWIIERSLCGRPGPAESPWNVNELYDGGIRAIISLDQDDVDHQAINDAGIEHMSFALPDSIPPTDEDATLWQKVLPQAFNYIKKWTSDSQGAIMVHCHAGKDRTGVLLGSYLTIVEGLDPKDAFSRLRVARPVAMTSEGYEAFFFDLMYKIKHQR